MSARDDILRRIRHGLGERDQLARRQAAESWLAGRQRGPQPVLSGDLPACFQGRAESLASSVSRVKGEAAVPAAVAAYLDGHGLGRQLVASAECVAYGWAASDLELEFRPANAADRVGLTACFCGIAETGTVLLRSGPSCPATVSLLPETHLVLLPVARIVASMEDAFALLRAEAAVLPRSLNFISGPSRTGDIEQTLVLGAHGPCRVHILLLEESA